MAISDKFALRLFRAAQSGLYCGEAIFELPIGTDRRVAVCHHDAAIYFCPAGSDDAELFSGRLERGLQAGLRAALLEVHPELGEELS